MELPKAHGAPVVNERYSVVAKNGVLSTYPPLAVVYLEGTFAKPAALTDKQMGQKDLAFNPSLLPIRLGTKVEFPNFDDTYHDVFSIPPPSGSTWDATGLTPSQCPRSSSTWQV